MTPPADKNVDYELGSIKSLLEVIRQTLSEDRLASAQYRTEVRKELREQSERMHEVAALTRQNAADLAELKPKVAHLEAASLKEEGAFVLANWLVKAVPAVLGALGGAAAYFFSGWMHPK